MINENYPMLPINIWPGSHESFWWQCPEKSYHKYQMSAKQRQRDDCPFCAGQRTHIRDSLARKHPKIAKEWNFEKNGDLKPTEVLPKSSLKVWWKCSLNPDHAPFPGIIGDRVKRKSIGCKKCNYSKRTALKRKPFRLYFPPNWGGPKNYYIKAKSISDLCQHMHLQIASVVAVLKGRRLKTGGFIIRYEPKSGETAPDVDFELSNRLRPRPKAIAYINLRNQGLPPKIAAQKVGLTNSHRLERIHAHLIIKK